METFRVDGSRTCEIGVALIGTDSRFVDSSIQKVRNFVLQDPRISLIEDAVDII